ncbi:hypothetical protein T492DRAFT_896598, partial [Pavlovales sp. CCMP2436]
MRAGLRPGRPARPPAAGPSHSVADAAQIASLEGELAEALDDADARGAREEQWKARAGQLAGRLSTEQQRRVLSIPPRTPSHSASLDGPRSPAVRALELGGERGWRESADAEAEVRSEAEALAEAELRAELAVADAIAWRTRAATLSTQLADEWGRKAVLRAHERVRVGAMLKRAHTVLCARARRVRRQGIARECLRSWHRVATATATRTVTETAASAARLARALGTMREQQAEVALAERRATMATLDAVLGSWATAAVAGSLRGALRVWVDAVLAEHTAAAALALALAQRDGAATAAAAAATATAAAAEAVAVATATARLARALGTMREQQAEVALAERRATMATLDAVLGSWAAAAVSGSLRGAFRMWAAIAPVEHAVARSAQAARAAALESALHSWGAGVEQLGVGAALRRWHDTALALEIAAERAALAADLRDAARALGALVAARTALVPPPSAQPALSKTEAPRVQFLAQDFLYSAAPPRTRAAAVAAAGRRPPPPQGTSAALLAATGEAEAVAARAAAAAVPPTGLPTEAVPASPTNSTVSRASGPLAGLRSGAASSTAAPSAAVAEVAAVATATARLARALGTMREQQAEVALAERRATIATLDAVLGSWAAAAVAGSLRGALRVWAVAVLAKQAAAAALALAASQRDEAATAAAVTATVAAAAAAAAAIATADVASDAAVAATTARLARALGTMREQQAEVVLAERRATMATLDAVLGSWAAAAVSGSLRGAFRVWAGAVLADHMAVAALALALAQRDGVATAAAAVAAALAEATAVTEVAAAATTARLARALGTMREQQAEVVLAERRATMATLDAVLGSWSAAAVSGSLRGAFRVWAGAVLAEHAAAVALALALAQRDGAVAAAAAVAEATAMTEAVATETAAAATAARLARVLGTMREQQAEVALAERRETMATLDAVLGSWATAAVAGSMRRGFRMWAGAVLVEHAVARSAQAARAAALESALHAWGAGVEQLGVGAALRRWHDTALALEIAAERAALAADLRDAARALGALVAARTALVPPPSAQPALSKTEAPRVQFLAQDFLYSAAPPRTRAAAVAAAGRRPPPPQGTSAALLAATGEAEAVAARAAAAAVPPTGLPTEAVPASPTNST